MNASPFFVVQSMESPAIVSSLTFPVLSWEKKVFSRTGWGPGARIPRSNRSARTATPM